MIVRGEWYRLLRPGLRKDFRDSYEMYPEEYSGFLHVGSQDEAQVDAITIGGTPRMVEVGEGEAAPSIDPVVGTRYTYYDNIFKLGFDITTEMMEDDRYKKADQHSKWLGKSARLTEEYEGAALLDDAFSGSTYTGDHGDALCATDHDLYGSASTGSNQLATATQLGVTGLQSMFDLGASTVDQRGYPMPVTIDVIVCDIADEWKAIQLTKNENEPYTTDRNINALRTKRRSMTYMVSHYKTQNDDWFTFDMNMHDAHFLFRVKPEMDDTFDKKTGVASYFVRSRINVYFHDWRGVMGTNP